MMRDISRRGFIVGSATICTANFLPKESKADPFVVGTLIGAVAMGVIGGIYALMTKKQEGLNSLELEKKRMVLQRIEHMFNYLPVNEQLALMQNGTYYNALMTGNIDGFSSLLALKDGKLYVSRDGNGDFVHSDMARPMQVVMNETGRLPIPTSHLKATEYRQGTDNATAYIADRMGINREEYLKNRAPKIISPMSLARSPRQGGEDFAFLTTLNRSNGYVSNGKQYAALEVNPVPMKVMRG